MRSGSASCELSGVLMRHCYYQHAPSCGRLDTIVADGRTLAVVARWIGSVSRRSDAGTLSPLTHHRCQAYLQVSGGPYPKHSDICRSVRRGKGAGYTQPDNPCAPSVNTHTARSVIARWRTRLKSAHRGIRQSATSMPGLRRTSDRMATQHFYTPRPKAGEAVPASAVAASGVYGRHSAERGASGLGHGPSTWHSPHCLSDLLPCAAQPVAGDKHDALHPTLLPYSRPWRIDSPICSLFFLP